MRAGTCPGATAAGAEPMPSLCRLPQPPWRAKRAASAATLIMRAHSASEDARKRADDTRPEPGSSARTVAITRRRDATDDAARAGRLFLKSSSRSSFLSEHDLFRKPLHTFRDHAFDHR